MQNQVPKLFWTYDDTFSKFKDSIRSKWTYLRIRDKFKDPQWILLFIQVQRSKRPEPHVQLKLSKPKKKRIGKQINWNQE